MRRGKEVGGEGMGKRKEKKRKNKQKVLKKRRNFIPEEHKEAITMKQTRREFWMSDAGKQYCQRLQEAGRLKHLTGRLVSFKVPPFQSHLL